MAKLSTNKKVINLCDFRNQISSEQEIFTAPLCELLLMKYECQD